MATTTIPSIVFKTGVLDKIMGGSNQFRRQNVSSKERRLMKYKKLFAYTALSMTVSLALADTQATMNCFWWPEQLNLQPLRQNSVESNPLGKTFNYAEQFKSLDLKAVKKDIASVLHTSQPWWSADYGNYGPFFIRPGTVPASTASSTAVAARPAASSALNRSTVGRITSIWTKPDDCCGRSNKNTAASYPGPT